jgi:hypothetical protein
MISSAASGGSVFGASAAAAGKSDIRQSVVRSPTVVRPGP